MSTFSVGDEGAISSRIPARYPWAFWSAFELVRLKRNLRRIQALAVPDILALLLIGATLAFLVARMPIDGRGDYGQWLMTSRSYLGQTVPDYRTITALPPLSQFPLAAARGRLHAPGAARPPSHGATRWGSGVGRCES